MLDTQEIGDTVPQWALFEKRNLFITFWWIVENEKSDWIWKNQRGPSILCGCSVRNTLCCDSLTLIPNSKASGCARSVCGQLNEEIPWLAEEAFVGQILHLVWIIQGSCIDAVAILDQEPCKKKKKKNRKRKRERKIGLAEWDWFLNLKLRLFATGVLDRALLTWTTLDMFQFPSIWNSCLPNSKLLCHNCEGQHNLKTTY